MIYIVLNLVPILAATVLGLMLGYGHHRFAGGSERTPSPGLIVTAALGEFWLASILAGALILAPPKADPWIMAVGSAVVIWAGFVLPLLAITLGYRGVPVRLIARDCGHWLILMVAQAVLMKSMGLVPPPT
ncbi:MAG: hypothetical protein B7Z50_00710 [Sphingomonadales bacterium 12-62-5]|uniref:hypothetical protein n=1 Tax=unclassified Sphingomonas TaxID=196159 RepID=UPI000BD1B062|nr:MAG: hypothetical protein B7Z50_00710 [Sphingomonadales bacterium 12-62-5]OYX38361.1 MAG: hypothetical protein B7Y98_09090 [Sphingomonas sp. 32-62-10]